MKASGVTVFHWKKRAAVRSARGAAASWPRPWGTEPVVPLLGSPSTGSGFSGAGVRNTFTADCHRWRVRGRCVGMGWCRYVTLCTKNGELDERLTSCFDFRSELFYFFKLLFTLCSLILLQFFIAVFIFHWFSSLTGWCDCWIIPALSSRFNSWSPLFFFYFLSCGLFLWTVFYFICLSTYWLDRFKTFTTTIKLI